MSNPPPTPNAPGPTSEEKCLLQMFAFVSHGTTAGGKLSDFDKFLSKIKLDDKRLGKLIYVGRILGIIDECITLACLLDGAKYPIWHQKDKKDRLIMTYVNQLKLDNGEFSDHLLLIKFFKTIQDYDEKEMGMTFGKWTFQHGINTDVFDSAADKKVRIVRILRRENYYNNMSANMNPESINLLIKCAVAAAFLPVGFYSTYGIRKSDPILYKLVTLPSGEQRKIFYDLTRTLTYKKFKFRSWAEKVQERDGRISTVQRNYNENIEGGIMSFFKKNGHKPEAIDLVIPEKKLNVVFPSSGPRFLNFTLPIYKYHRYQQLGKGDVTIMGQHHGHYKAVDKAVGPHNPLEIKFKSLVIKPIEKENVRVDGTSVCSAVFDPNYHHDPEKNNSRRFLLIGSILSTQAHNVLITKCNTLYHEGEGQLEITLLLFGPSIQLYIESEGAISFRDYLKKNCTQHGFSSIGPERNPPHSSYMDLPANLKAFSVGSRQGNDELWGMPVPCQFEITYDDIERIFKIRNRMKTFSSLTPGPLQELREDIVGLLNKRRGRVQQPLSRQDLDSNTSCLNLPPFQN